MPSRSTRAAPADWIAFKLQLSGHTAFYGDSDLSPVSGNSLLLIVGGTLGFSPRTSLDIGVSEDLSVDAAPDVALHLALRHCF